MRMSEPNNVVSIAEWKAKHQHEPVVWTYYVVVPDPNAKHGYRLELVERRRISFD
jgi:hypothetical protein